jgi:hypothetical protein
LGPELQQLCSALLPDSLQVVREKVHDTMSCYWMTLLKTHPLDRQRDAHFQNLLSISLEKLVYFISGTYEVYQHLTVFFLASVAQNECIFMMCSFSSLSFSLHTNFIPETSWDIDTI